MYSLGTFLCIRIMHLILVCCYYVPLSEEGDDYTDAPENGVGSAKKSRRKSKVSAKPKKTEANK